MRAIVFTGGGGPEVMSLEQRPDPVPGSDEVLVAATHSGINPADLNQRAGHYPAPPGAPADVPGLEVSGTVVAVGRNVSEWREGDRVFGVVGGGGHAPKGSRARSRRTNSRGGNGRARPRPLITRRIAAGIWSESKRG